MGVPYGQLLDNLSKEAEEVTELCQDRQGVGFRV